MECHTNLVRAALMFWNKPKSRTRINRVTDDADVRAIIEQLADSGVLCTSAQGLKRYMLKVSDLIAPPGDSEFAALLQVARLNVEEGCAQDELRAARIRAVNGRDARKGVPPLEAAYRTIRFLLEPRD